MKKRMLKSLFSTLWENILTAVKSRVFFLCLFFITLSLILVYRLFQLQIVEGEEYLENFELKIRKERSLPATRGNIYDRYGKLLAYNELAYSVTIEDVYESGSSKNKNLNATILKTIQYIESNGDSLISNFDIELDETGDYVFRVEGKTLKRFLADVYGRTTIDKLSYEEETSTPQQVIDYLCGRSKYGIGDFTDPEDSSTFQPGLGYTKEEILKLITVRYAMSANGYQKYISTAIATDVSEKTVAVIMENQNDLNGVNIEEDTIRKYVDGTYFSQIIGYTGRISPTELTEYKEQDESYSMNDHVGKDGIEQYMELYLQGNKGSETVYVDNMGKVIETSDVVEPSAGNDVYLTIDKDLQEAIYKILEQKIAGILVANIKNVKTAPASNSGEIVIPIYEVYYALINNTVIDIEAFTEEGASETEQNVYATFCAKNEIVRENLKNELLDKATVYSALSEEYRIYESYIVSMLESKGIINSSLVDKTDETYISWAKEETISLKEYLNYCIAQNWIDISAFQLKEDDKYNSTEELYALMVDFILDKLSSDKTFQKKIYYYLIMDDQITGRQLCKILIDQDIIFPGVEELNGLESGSISSFDFMQYLISNLLLTPAQLALDPCSGSCVVTDVNTGEVLALVSYPSYDNNRLANTVDAEYYAEALADLSNPFWNYATQQKTAPGSTFKMVTGITGLEEGVVGRYENIRCTGYYDKLSNAVYKCWIAPGAHSELNVVGGIKNSCNYYFYEVGYRLSQINGSFDNDYGLERMKKYAELFGLTQKSGIEISESEPTFSTQYSVQSAIGQGTHNYTTVGLARYVTTIANSGTCYDLTLLDKVTDSKGNVVVEYNPDDRVVDHVDIAQSSWDAVHEGMKQVVESKAYYSDLGVTVAGKTGTAQEDKSRPNHALFVCYAPYEEPEIAMAVRIAFGYSSNYAAESAKDVLQYYYDLVDTDQILNGVADELESSGGNTD